MFLKPAQAGLFAALGIAVPPDVEASAQEVSCRRGGQRQRLRFTL